MPSQHNSRETLRRQLRQARRHLSEQEQSLAADQLVLHLQDGYLASLFSSETTVAIYLSNDGEISPHSLCNYFWQHSITTYLPVLNDKALLFAQYTSDTEWIENRFGIKEPIDANPIDGLELDLVFLPLVGFDRAGGRLGMGGGFYDRTFEHKVAGKKPLLIGLAHDCQEVAQLPVESWDVPLDMIITPSSLIKLS